MLKLLIPAIVSVMSLTAFAAGTSETLLGYKADQEGISFQVASGGCTTKENFLLQVTPGKPAQLELSRNVPDYCEAFLPYGVPIQFSYKELGLSRSSEFVIKNQLSVLRVY